MTAQSISGIAVFLLYCHLTCVIEHTLCYIIKCILIDHSFKDLGCLGYFDDIVTLKRKHGIILDWKY